MTLAANHDAATTAELDARAKAILRGNDRGGYTVPTEGLYPYQWNWDSAFAAWGFAAFDLDRAWVELETLFSGQWANGMVPHILFHREDAGYFPGPDVWGAGETIPSSGISQPPVAATMARAIFERDPQAGAPRMAPLYDKLLAWHRWFYQHRCESGACCITHPWESGRDNAPDWDGALKGIDTSNVGPYTRRDTSHVNPDMRPTKRDYDCYITLVQFGRACDWDEAEILANSPFRVADPTMTFILLRAHRDLKWLGTTLGHDTTEIDGWIAELEAGVESLWNDDVGVYDARDLRSGELAGSPSNASFLCWYAGVSSPKTEARLARILSKVTYGVPSYDPEGPLFDHMRYWRGPVWGMMNTMIGMGLADAGLTDLATQVRDDTAALIADHGFAEYFSPLDGTPAGGGTFTWTAAVWLGWASPSAQKGA
ncbi:hypothetical protein [Pseudoruegeria sp. SK021]|uniref:MGH1-like glycoside hydrolase domain-containing protein n=1 Tax=Pseudoruegeria sp. SK021 TaxID=1933035 RepID=UPI000A23D18A|nr:hypothetical protein [Pseudoruegeria sp. SK021]OSP56003.1 hypothetical protein BV911_04995 [Pseudoruegeria sp. SK021]